MKPNDKAIEAGYNACTTVSRSIVIDIITAAYAAQFNSEDYAELVKELREDVLQFNLKDTVYENVAKKAADAIEALLAKMDALKDALEAEQSTCIKVGNELAVALLERDALAARLAPIEPIESDKDDPTREYIPLPGGWEIQTKGKGSSYRLLDKKTGERHMILASDVPFIHAFVTRMAKEINASAQVQPVAPVDDDALVEIAAKHVAGIDGHSDDWDRYVDETKDYIDAVRPHIEAAERKRCAKKIEPTGPRPCDCDSCDCGNKDDAERVAAWDEAMANAAAIRSGK